MGEPVLEARLFKGPLLFTCDWLVFPAGGGGMKREPAPELGCCHKTKPLRSTGSILSPSLDFQPCQEDRVRWNPGPIFEASLLMEGGDIRRK